MKKTYHVVALDDQKILHQFDIEAHSPAWAEEEAKNKVVELIGCDRDQVVIESVEEQK